MGSLTPEQHARADYILATIILSHGSGIPEYLSKFSIIDRITIIASLNKYTDLPMAPEMQMTLIFNPGIFSELFKQNPLLATIYDYLGSLAQAILGTWDAKEIQAELDKMSYQVNPGRNAKYN